MITLIPTTCDAGMASITSTANVDQSSKGTKPTAMPPPESRKSRDRGTSTSEAGHTVHPAEPGNKAATETTTEEISSSRCTLSAKDLTYRSVLEKAVSDGIASSIVAAESLHLIHAHNDGVLWKREFRSFEAYCNSRWDIGRSHAYRLVDGGSFLNDLKKVSPNGEWRPTSEGQIRPLLSLPIDERVKVWIQIVEAVGIDKATSSLVARKVKERSAALCLTTESASKPAPTTVTASPASTVSATADQTITVVSATIERDEQLATLAIALSAAATSHPRESEIKGYVGHIQECLTSPTMLAAVSVVTVSSTPVPCAGPVTPVLVLSAASTPTKENQRQLRDQKVHTAIEALQGIANDDRDSVNIGKVIERLINVLFQPLPVALESGGELA